MILSPVLNVTTGDKLTVGDAEIMTPYKPAGTYFYIAVTPQKMPQN